MKTLEERQRILDEEVIRLIGKGWIVQNRTETTCFLKKENVALGCLSIIVSLLVIFPFFETHLKTRAIEVSPEGKIKRSWLNF